MSKVTIKLAPRDVMCNVFLGDRAVETVRDALPRYTNAGTFEFEQEGQDAAEEAFDLTNNPSRDEERAAIYGRGRSVSSGDVIDVDGTNYLCMSIGWRIL